MSAPSRPNGSRFGKHDKTGRSSGRLKNNNKRPPTGEPWIWHTRELISSTAWRSQSLLCRRFIEFLEIEHMNHAGTMNGRLKATYDQLMKAGINRRWIKSTIDEAEALGLVLVKRGGPWWKPSKASSYTLTYYSADEAPATNRWKKPNLKAAAAAVAIRSEKNLGIRRVILDQYQTCDTGFALTRNLDSQDSWDCPPSTQYQTGDTSSIFRWVSADGEDVAGQSGDSANRPWRKPIFIEVTWD